MSRINDIAIVGGGLAGASLAVALQKLSGKQFAAGAFFQTTWPGRLGGQGRASLKKGSPGFVAALLSLAVFLDRTW